MNGKRNRDPGNPFPRHPSCGRPKAHAFESACELIPRHLKGHFGIGRVDRADVFVRLSAPRLMEDLICFPLGVAHDTDLPFVARASRTQRPSSCAFLRASSRSFFILPSPFTTR